MKTPDWWIRLCFKYFNLYRDRVREPYIILTHAQHHLAKDFVYRASTTERGTLTPAQYQAFEILEECRRPLLGSTDVWVA